MELRWLHLGQVGFNWAGTQSDLKGGHVCAHMGKLTPNNIHMLDMGRVNRESVGLIWAPWKLQTELSWPRLMFCRV